MLKGLSRLFFKPTVAGAIKPLTETLDNLNYVVDYNLEENLALDSQLVELERQIKANMKEQAEAQKYANLINKLLNS